MPLFDNSAIKKNVLVLKYGKVLWSGAVFFSFHFSHKSLLCFLCAIIYDNKYLMMQNDSCNLLTIYVSNIYLHKYASVCSSVQDIHFSKWNSLSLCWLRLCLALITTALQMKCCQDLHMDHSSKAKIHSAWQNK